MILCHILPERRVWVNIIYIYIYIYIYVCVCVCVCVCTRSVKKARKLVSQTNHFNNKLQSFPLKSSSLSLMHSLILLGYASMHCWKDSSGMTCLRNGSPSWTPWDWIKEKVMRNKIRRIGRSFHYKGWSSRPETSGCWAYPVPLLFKHAQIYDDHLSNSVLFSCSVILQAINGQSPHITCLNHFTLISVLLVEGLPLLESLVYLPHSINKTYNH